MGDFSGMERTSTWTGWYDEFDKQVALLWSFFFRRRGSFLWNTLWYSTLVTFSRLFSGLLRIGILWFVGQLRSRHSYILSEWASASSRCSGSSMLELFFFYVELDDLVLLCWHSTSQVETFVVWTTEFVIRPLFAACFPVELAAEMACRHNWKFFRLCNVTWIDSLRL